MERKHPSEVYLPALQVLVQNSSYRFEKSQSSGLPTQKPTKERKEMIFMKLTQYPLLMSFGTVPLAGPD